MIVCSTTSDFRMELAGFFCRTFPISTCSVVLVSEPS
jgi:hypothetical protein